MITKAGQLVDFNNLWYIKPLHKSSSAEDWTKTANSKPIAGNISNWLNRKVKSPFIIAIKAQNPFKTNPINNPKNKYAILFPLVLVAIFSII